MASARSQLNFASEPVQVMNAASAGFDPARGLPQGFIEFFLPFRRAFTPRQRDLVGRRASTVEAAHQGQLPNYLRPSPAMQESWRIELPEWCQDQRNQMTAPADDAELVVKMLNEDSMVNTWPHLMQGVTNILAALRGDSGVIQAMLKRLAEEEEQIKREKAAGSVDATKPLMAKAAAY
jgi:hypothetical protein